ncbi:MULTISPECIES: ATP-binding protein [unclassified Frankia]|uniref:ATP-binding protein n=1 Tax=unclassified Frankia TaxID=2632575 RepID=UPI00351CD7A1
MTISNSAPGLDPAWTAAAFARGWSTKAGGALHGRGLGLALLQQVVARYGGRIDVTNDRGAVFTVRLPLEPVVVEVADVVGISRVTARRYREHLTGQHLTSRTRRYGTTGRPPSPAIAGQAGEQTLRCVGRASRTSRSGLPRGFPIRAARMLVAWCLCPARRPLLVTSSETLLTSPVCMPTSLSRPASNAD